MKAIKRYQVALELAEEAHAGQTRKWGDDKGLDYIVHPRRVANRAYIVAKRFFYSEKIACEIASVAAVHDVPEDCADKGYTIDSVGDTLEFNWWQRRALELVTKPEEGIEYSKFILSIVSELDWSRTLAVVGDSSPARRLAAYAAGITKSCDLEDNLVGCRGGNEAKYKLSLYILKDKFDLNLSK